MALNPECEKVVRPQQLEALQCLCVLASPDVERHRGSFPLQHGARVVLPAGPRGDQGDLFPYEEAAAGIAWDESELARAIQGDLAAGLTDLATDLEFFNTEPVV